VAALEALRLVVLVALVAGELVVIHLVELEPLQPQTQEAVVVEVVMTAPSLMAMEQQAVQVSSS
jgi:hypothetical protein